MFGCNDHIDAHLEKFICYFRCFGTAAGDLCFTQIDSLHCLHSINMRAPERFRSSVKIVSGSC